jgi:hypothetical protein
MSELAERRGLPLAPARSRDRMVSSVRTETKKQKKVARDDA